MDKINPTGIRRKVALEIGLSSKEEAIYLLFIATEQQVKNYMNAKKAKEKGNGTII